MNSVRVAAAVTMFVAGSSFVTQANAADGGFLSMLQGMAKSTTWEVGSGVDYSTGRYGQTSDTSVISVPVSANVQIDRLRLELTIPWLDVKGPGAYIGGIVIPGKGTPMTNSGLGDVNLGAAWLVHRDGDVWPAVEIAGSLKLPTASKGLGTGKWDYSAALNFYHSFSPRFMLFGTIGYQWLSNFSTYTLQNGVMASAGVNFKPSTDTAIGATVNYRAQYFQGFGAQYSLSPYALWNFNDHWRVTGYGMFGFSQASPRIGGGIRLTLFG